jgi:hypothetical protein
MKWLFASLLMLITLTAGAKPFMLEFDTSNSNDTIIKFNEKEWEFVARDEDWSMYLARGETDNYKGLPYLHTMVIYNEPKKSDLTEEPIKKIFNFGLVDCGNERIFLLRDFFTTADNKIIWISKYELGEFTTDVPEGSPRAKVYKLLCEGQNI